MKAGWDTSGPVKNWLNVAEARADGGGLETKLDFMVFPSLKGEERNASKVGEN